MKSPFHLTGAASRFADTTLCTMLVWVLRVIVGCVFLFSGFAKAIDPWGGYYKFVEYFNAFGWDSMVPLAMACSVGLALAEFLLGLFAITGCYRRTTPVLLLAVMCVMLPVSAWLWATDAIADCGCFGDAVHLSNGATFAKNLVLVPAIVYLLLFNRRVHGIYGPAVNWAVTLLGAMYVAALASVGYLVQPMVDFRAYPVGTRIAAQSTASAGADDYVFTYEKDGEQRDFTIDNLPDDDSGWNYVDRHLTAAAEEKMPAIIVQPISVIDTTGTDITEDALPPTGDGLIFTFPDLADANLAYSFRLGALAERAEQQGAQVWAATSAKRDVVARWADESHARYPIYTVDDTDIKSLVRGNPAAVFVHDGRVVWKRTIASLDNARLHDDSLTLADLGAIGGPGLKTFTLLFALCLAALLLVNRTHVAVRAIVRLFKRKKVTDGEPQAADAEPETEAGQAPEPEQPAEAGNDEK